MRSTFWIVLSLWMAPAMHGGHVRMERGALTESSAQTVAPASTYILRGHDAHPAKIATDSDGNTYIAGDSESDAFLTKLDVNFRHVYTIFWGGQGPETVGGLAIGPGGDIFVAGQTNSTDYPVIQAAQQAIRGQSDGFLARFAPNGGLLYSTYLGGSKADSIAALAVDQAGNAYVTGTTLSQDFPVTATAFQKSMTAANPFAMPAAAFVAKYSADGQVAYTTFLSGTRVTCIGGSSCIPSISITRGSAIAVDSSGSAYVGGDTNTSDFPVTQGAFQTTCLCRFQSSDVFLTKLKADGSGPIFSTYIPAAPPSSNDAGDTLQQLTLDSSGNVYAAGFTGSLAFPTTPGALQPSTISGLSINLIFALKLAAAGDRLLYSALVASGFPIMTTGIQVNAQGSAFLSGRRRNDDYFIGINALGTALTYNAMLPSGSANRGIAMNGAGDVYLLGSSGFISRNIAVNNSMNPATISGVANAAGMTLRASIAPGELISIYGNGVGPAQNTGAKLAANGRLETELAGTRVTLNGTALPLTFAGPNQINAVAPLGLIPNEPVLLDVTKNGLSTASIGLWTSATLPEVFRGAPISSPTAIGPAAALNQDGSVNSEANPATSGSIVSIFVSGLGKTTGGLQDGEIASTSDPRPLVPFKIIARNLCDCQILFVGQAPALVAGVTQINFKLPLVRGASMIVLNLQAGDFESEDFTIYASGL